MKNKMLIMLALCSIGVNILSFWGELKPKELAKVNEEAKEKTLEEVIKDYAEPYKNDPSYENASRLIAALNGYKAAKPERKTISENKKINAEVEEVIGKNIKTLTSEISKRVGEEREKAKGQQPKPVKAEQPTVGEGPPPLPPRDEEVKVREEFDKVKEGVAKIIEEVKATVTVLKSKGVTQEMIKTEGIKWVNDTLDWINYKGHEEQSPDKIKEDIERELDEIKKSPDFGELADDNPLKQAILDYNVENEIKKQVEAEVDYITPITEALKERKAELEGQAGGGGAETGGGAGGGAGQPANVKVEISELPDMEMLTIKAAGKIYLFQNNPNDKDDIRDFNIEYADKLESDVDQQLLGEIVQDIKKELAGKDDKEIILLSEALANSFENAEFNNKNVDKLKVIAKAFYDLLKNKDAIEAAGLKGWAQ